MLLFSILVASVGCGKPSGQGVSAADIPNGQDSSCTPTDQDQYVWRPGRLKLLQPCRQVTGTVTVVSAEEPDGDIHIELRPDASYQALLTAGNLNGNLVLEAVCQYVPPMIEALRLCASDPDPYLGPFPQIGDHIWVEGRYVLDLWHGSQAELHPIYRWGKINP